MRIKKKTKQSKVFEELSITNRYLSCCYFETITYRNRTHVYVETAYVIYFDNFKI